MVCLFVPCKCTSVTYIESAFSVMLKAHHLHLCRKRLSICNTQSHTIMVFIVHHNCWTYSTQKDNLKNIMSTWTRTQLSMYDVHL
jgi:hypothetical protein